MESHGKLNCIPNRLIHDHHPNSSLVHVLGALTPNGEPTVGRLEGVLLVTRKGWYMWASLNKTLQGKRTNGLKPIGNWLEVSLLKYKLNQYVCDRCGSKPNCPLHDVCAQGRSRHLP